jgi:hypothetical protein
MTKRRLDRAGVKFGRISFIHSIHHHNYASLMKSHSLHTRTAKLSMAEAGSSLGMEGSGRELQGMLPGKFNKELGEAKQCSKGLFF